MQRDHKTEHFWEELYFEMLRQNVLTVSGCVPGGLDHLEVEYDGLTTDDFPKI